MQRWASELNTYAGQSANPGIRANNYYQIAGYRQGLLPVTKHIEATRAAATAPFEAARREAATDADSVEVIVHFLAKSAELEINPENAGALLVLAEARTLMRAKGRGGHDPEIFAGETAAWLAEADRRGQSSRNRLSRLFQRLPMRTRKSAFARSDAASSLAGQLTYINNGSPRLRLASAPLRCAFKENP